jgi:hypothetical protein
MRPVGRLRLTEAIKEKRSRVRARKPVEKAGLPGLNEGQVVEYEEVSNRGKTSAENLKVSR